MSKPYTGRCKDPAEIATEVITSAFECSEWRPVRAGWQRWFQAILPARQ
jgi:hypothetical protein